MLTGMSVQALFKPELPRAAKETASQATTLRRCFARGWIRTGEQWLPA